MEEIFVFGSITFEPKLHRASYNGTTVPMSPTELKLLGLLIQNADRITRSVILIGAIWGKERAASAAYRSPLRKSICRLRSRLEGVGCYDPTIESRPHVGYGILRTETSHPVWN